MPLIANQDLLGVNDIISVTNNLISLFFIIKKVQV